MTTNTTCAGCTSPSGPFTCAVNGVLVRLCAECAARLMKGEPKGDVIKTNNQKVA